MKTILKNSSIVSGLVAALIVCGCSKSGDVPRANTPEQAAAGLDQTFATAPPEVRNHVSAASEALRKRDYEKAVVTLHQAQKTEGITLQQGIAIHNSSVLLEAELIKAMENGDPRAKATYELLRRSKRN
jgi:hypothetical protein